MESEPPPRDLATAQVRLLERVAADRHGGQHWRARQRLEQFLARHGYVPEALEVLGRICHEMHDDRAAGRYWLLSPAEGEEVERAVALFVAESRPMRGWGSSGLPGWARPGSADAFPAAARRRIASHGLEAVLASPPRRASRPAGGLAGAPGADPGLRGTALAAGCLGLLLLGGSIFLVGLVTSLRWLFG